MVPAGARCATHVEVAAVDVCQRCGRFLCGECIDIVGDDPYCAECAPRMNVPASKLAKAALIVTGLAWLSFGLPSFALRVRLFVLVLVLVPGPAALAAMVMGIMEWRRIKAGLSPARGKRWVIATFVFATPLFLLMALLFAYGAFKLL